MKPNYWLDRVAEAQGGCSDYRLSQLLGISKQAVSLMRQGKTKTLDDATAQRVEVLLDLKPGTVMLDQLQERAPNDEVRAVWQKLGKIVAGVAATIVLTLAMAVGAPQRALAAVSADGQWVGTLPYYYRNNWNWQSESRHPTHRSDLRPASIRLRFTTERWPPPITVSPARCRCRYPAAASAVN